MPGPRFSLLLAALLAAGCTEWVALAPEPESYPLETAQRICRSHAEKEAEMGPVFSTGRTRSDPGVYSRAFSRCMRAHGWVLRRKQSEAAEPQPDAEDEPQPDQRAE